MFVKLAFRNMKRQIGNYLIYFITVTLTVALMFAIHSVIYSKELQAFAATIKQMKDGLTLISCMIGLIVAFVLGYATSFMLKLRKREFGTYLTMGMTRGNIVRLFVLETLFLGGLSLGAGIGIGLFFYQGMMAVMANLLEMETAFAAYSADALILTAAAVAGIFILASLTSAWYLKRVSIYDLIHGDKKNEKEAKHPWAWFAAALCCLAGMIYYFYAFYESAMALMGSVTGGTSQLMTELALFAVCLVLFHVAAARSLVNLLLRNRKFAGRGTNTFVLRQLSSQMRANAWMTGILAFLITFSAVGANVSFTQKTSEETALNRYVPFDVVGTLEPGVSQYGADAAEAIIKDYGEIERKIEWKTYTDGKGEITHGYTEFTGDGYQNLTDTFMKISDFNRFAEAAGYPTVPSDHQFYILRDIAFQADFTDAVLTRNGMTCTFGGLLEQYPRASFVYFIILIPDEMAEGMDVESEMVGFDLKEKPTDAAALREALTYTVQEKVAPGEWEPYDRCDYRVKEYSRIQNNSTSAILVVGALYAAAVFVFLSMAILALKTLAGLSEDVKKYRILFRLGAGEKEERKALFRQTFCFFFLPFGLPFLLNIPVAMVCAQMMRASGYEELVKGVYLTAGGIAGVLLGIYVLYFAATYRIARRNVVEGDG